MLVDLLVDVAELIEATIAVQKVAVTPGQPAASDKCSAAYVWGNQIFDSPIGTQARGDEAGCVYRRAYEIGYRIDVCVDMNEDGSELSTADYATLSQTFYDYADLVWCAITHAAAGGTLFQTIETCEDIVVGALLFGSPIGDRVSATGSIRVTHPCPAEAS